MEHVWENGDYQYGMQDDEPFEILRYTGSESNVFVPNYPPVFRIGDEAFKGCGSLTNVVIGSGIWQIGARAFSGCHSLRSVRIPESVIWIDDSAFEGCPASLKLIVTPDSVGHRWAMANHRCVEISSSAFEYGFYTQWPHCAVIEKYIGHEESVVLARELDGYPVAGIGERAFWGCESLKEIVFPEGLADIAEEAFYGCTSLTRVALPDGLRGIGSWAFSGCKSLSRVAIPASVTTIGFDAFKGCAEDLTLIVAKDSYAHHWAVQMELPYLYPEDCD